MLNTFAAAFEREQRSGRNWSYRILLIIEDRSTKNSEKNWVTFAKNKSNFFFEKRFGRNKKVFTFAAAFEREQRSDKDWGYRKARDSGRYRHLRPEKGDKVKSRKKSKKLINFLAETKKCLPLSPRKWGNVLVKMKRKRGEDFTGKRWKTK